MPLPPLHRASGCVRINSTATRPRRRTARTASFAPTFRIAVGDVAAARKSLRAGIHVVDGVVIARELVNEPPNVLYPVEFARRASQLKKLGVEVEVLDVKAMKKLGMGALLGVAQGSTQPGPHRDHALERRQEGGSAGCLSSQGRLPSIPAAFHQGRRQHGRT